MCAKQYEKVREAVIDIVLKVILCTDSDKRSLFSFCFDLGNCGTKGEDIKASSRPNWTL